MYDSFYNVAENPFKICTDPRFLWCGEKHSLILSSLIYGLMDHNGLVVLTGEIGTGKTTLVNALLKILDSDVIVAKINHPRLGAIEFLTLVAKSLDPHYTGRDKSDLLLFFDSFVRRAQSEGKIILLIIDEAQHLSTELLEEIRLLSNMEQAGQRILSIMLVGQTELKSMIESPQSRSFHQRVTLFCEIEALSEMDTPLYVEYRLKVSGQQEQLFTAGAMRMIHSFSHGNPRLINILCDRAMRIGYMKKQKKIDADIIIECGRDMHLCNRVRAKALGLLGPQSPIRPINLGAKLKRWLATAGPALQDVQSRLRNHIEVIVHQIRSQCRTFADNRLAVWGRSFNQRRLKKSYVWIAVIGLLATSTTIGIYKATRDKKHPDVTAVAVETSVQWSERTSNTNLHWVNSGKATEDPTLLASTSPTAEQHWYRNQARQAATARAQAGLGPLNPAPQPTASDPEPTPVQLAATALEKHDYKRALELIELHQAAGAEKNRQTAEFYAEALQGRALEIMDMSPSSAEAMLLKAIDLSPDNARVYLSIGKYRTLAKQYPQAIDAYRHAIRLDPDLSDALFNLGYIYATTGKFENAETAFSRAVQLKPPYLGKSLFNLAVVQQKMGKMEQSLANLEKAVSVMPNNEKASAYLSRLKQATTGGSGGQGR